MDGVFYGIAVTAAFRIAYRRMSGVEKAQLVAHSEQTDWHKESEAA
ncbi:MAG: hypothetical protein ACYTGF_13550 [Planctomycetota bacterium]|jgi:hypothetical protein